MRDIRLYFPELGVELSEVESIFTLPATDKRFHYLVRVLRLKVNQEIIIFSGQGHISTAQILSIDKKNIELQLLTFHKVDKKGLDLHLYIGISKGDRMDYALQKSVELGVSAITPLFTEYGDIKLKNERLQKKLNHWQGVLIAACEQCELNYLPTLNTPTSIADYTYALSNSADSLQQSIRLKAVLHPGGQSFQPLAEQTYTSIDLLVGAEGGFSCQEIEELTTNGVVLLGLGPRILRTETAPLVALSLIQYLWGDINEVSIR